MKDIRIGLTNNSPTPLLHDYCGIKSGGEISVSVFLANKEQISHNRFENPIFFHKFAENCQFKIKNHILTVESVGWDERFSLNCDESNNLNKLFAVATVKSSSNSLSITESLNSNSIKMYIGQLMIIADKNKLREILFHSLEDYVQSVLHGEIPATYHLEAIKAQAICARTYALNPRVNHKDDFCNVCDSYLCCQCFVEKPKRADSPYAQATQGTDQLILTYKNKPALALFSACGGGHTENYEDCFSDLQTKAFPATPIPYLKGVSESIEIKLGQQKLDVQSLKNLWQDHKPETIDGWSKNFRWSINLSKEDLESQLHFNISQLIKQEDFAPFVIPPPSGIFGEIISFSTIERGCGGTLIELQIETNKGIWRIKKELAIRNVFKHSKINLKRLASARIYFDQIRDAKGDLANLKIFGLGSGHGVGLQQVGAQGFARLGKNHREIINHYYNDITIEKI